MKVVGILLLIAVASATYLHPNKSIIDEINSSQSLWIAGENQRFTGKDLSHVKMLLGSLKTPEEKKLPIKHMLHNENLPDNFDLREAYPNCTSLKEVRDQSNCGSCWAFGAVEAMSDRICIKSGQKLQTRISSEDLVSCCSSCGYGCDGGYPGAAWSYFKSKGLVTGGLYQDNSTCLPYAFKPCDHHVVGKYGPCGGEEYPTPKCVSTCNSDYKGPAWKQDKWFASDAYRVPANEKSIMTEIFNNGSVEVDFEVYEDFINYKSGVYKHTTGKYLGGHAIKMIGWGVENGVKYWILVNSWNEGWGDNGTFKMIRGINHCGIEGDVNAGTPILK